MGDGVWGLGKAVHAEGGAAKKSLCRGLNGVWDLRARLR